MPAGWASAWRCRCVQVRLRRCALRHRRPFTVPWPRLAITAFRSLARILKDRGLTRPIGQLALASAAIADVFAWIMLALVVALLQRARGGTTSSAIVRVSCGRWSVAIDGLDRAFSSSAPARWPPQPGWVCMRSLAHS